MAQSKKQKKEVARKRAKARARGQLKQPATRTNLEDTIAQLQAALVNMRKLYDQAMEEQAVLRAAINNRDQIITALAVEYTGVSVKQSTVAEVTSGAYVGYEQEVEDGELFIFAIGKDDLEDEDTEERTEEVEEADEG